MEREDVPVTFVHLSDLHLLAGEPGDSVAEDFGRVLECATAITPRPAFCVVTGDLTDDGEEGSYRRARALLDLLEGAGIPVLAALGNHDDRAAFRRGFLGAALDDDSPHVHARVIAGVGVAVLDSSAPGRVAGAIDDGQLAWLDRTLAGPAPRGWLVAIHHAARLASVQANSWFVLEGAADLEAVLVRHQPRVLGVLAGHTHQANAAIFGGILHATAPAVAGQLDHLAPGGLVSHPQPGFAVGVLDPEGLVVHSVLLSASQTPGC